MWATECDIWPIGPAASLNPAKLIHLIELDFGLGASQTLTEQWRMGYDHRYFTFLLKAISLLFLFIIPLSNWVFLDFLPDSDPQAETGFFFVFFCFFTMK